MERELVLQAFKSTGFLVVNKLLLKSLGLTKAILFSLYVDKTIYFQEHYPENDGWFFAVAQKIKEELGISDYTLTKTKKELKEMGLIELKRKGIPSKEWIRINTKKLVQILSKERTKNQNLKKLAPTNSQGLESANSQGLYKETKNKETKNKETKNRKNSNLQVSPHLDHYPQEWKDSSTFVRALRNYVEYRKEIKRPLTKRGAKQLAKKLKKYSIQTAKKALYRSIENGWTGVFPESIQSNHIKKRSTPINTCGSRAFQDDDDEKIKYPKGEVFDVTKVIKFNEKRNSDEEAA